MARSIEFNKGSVGGKRKRNLTVLAASRQHEVRLFFLRGMCYLQMHCVWSRMPVDCVVIHASLLADLNSELEGDFMAKWLDQAKKKQATAAGKGTFKDADFLKKYPAISEFCTLVLNTDGTTRETSSLLFFVEGPVWKVCLNDREAAMTLWASGEAFEEALEALEAMLQSGDAPWRLSGKRTDRKPKK